eukprot:gene3922-7133_t
MSNEEASRTPTDEEILAENNNFVHWQRSAEINLAMQLSKSRERFRWAFGYTSVLTIGTLSRFMLVGKFPVAMLLPISAIITYAGYEYDLGYGSKLSRVNLEAHKILNQERYKYFGKF